MTPPLRSSVAVTSAPAHEALNIRRVFGVDGQVAPAVTLERLGNRLARHGERFLVREGDALTGGQSRKNGGQPGKSDYRRDHCVDLVISGDFAYPLFSHQYLDGEIADEVDKVPAAGFVANHGNAGHELAYLLGQLLHV